MFFRKIIRVTNILKNLINYAINIVTYSIIIKINNNFKSDFGKKYMLF